MNTLYKESSQGVSSLSAEKVVEVIEHVLFFEGNSSVGCYERRHGEKLSPMGCRFF